MFVQKYLSLHICLIIILALKKSKFNSYKAV